MSADSHWWDNNSRHSQHTQTTTEDYSAFHQVATSPHLLSSMTPKSYKIAYLGLGNMGLPISRNLVKYISENSLPQLLVWNRSKEKYAQIPEAKGVEQPEDVLHEGCNVVFTSLLNDEVAEEIYDKLFGAVKGKGEVVFVEHSTLNPKTSGEFYPSFFRDNTLVNRN